MKYLQDIIIAVLLLLGLISGFISGGVKKGTRLLVVLGAVFGLYFGLKDIIVDFLRYDLLALVTKDQGFSVSINESLVIHVMNFEDLFVILQNADENLTAVQLKATCEVFFTVVTFLLILLAVELISFPISFLLYHLVFKFVFLQVGKKPKAISRVLGGVFGLVEVLVFTYFYMVSFGQFSCLFDEFTLIYQALPAGSVPALDQFMEIFKTINEGANYKSSFILSGIINSLQSAGADPFSFVSITVDGSKEKITLPIAIKGIHDAAFDSIVDFIGSIANQGSPAPDAPVEGESLAQLYNFSFN